MTCAHHQRHRHEKTESDNQTETQKFYDRMLRETDFSRQRDLMRQFEKLVLDTEAHEIFLL
jgi:hypothetical protein